MILMLCRAACRFIELKALVASTKSTFDILIGEGLTHRVNGCLTTTFLTGTNLEGTRGFQDVLLQHDKIALAIILL